MKTKNLARIAALVLAALLLAGCGTQSAAPDTPAEETPMAQSPESTPAEETPSAEPVPAEPEAPPIEAPEGALQVSTVDELLAALGSDRDIVLAPGRYELASATGYGTDSGENWRWEEWEDGYGLCLDKLQNLRLLAPEGAEIVAEARYADVLSFFQCSDVTLAGLSMGHSFKPEICTGNALELNDCGDFTLESCGLYGCGVIGLYAVNCWNLTLRFCRIYDCSWSAVTAYGSRMLTVEDCEIDSCGDNGNALFQLDSCRDVCLLNSRIHNNNMTCLLSTYDSDLVELLGCRVEHNVFQSGMFQLSGKPAMVDRCSFVSNGPGRYYDLQPYQAFAQSLDGQELLSFDLDRMTWERVEQGAAAPETSEEKEEISVSNVDELLAAIAPNVRLVLEPGDYDLSSAEGYGTKDGKWYAWREVYDGYELELNGVDGLQIVASGRKSTQILAAPRYATVLSFLNCSDISLSGFTAGHTQGMGTCSGNVLGLKGCRNVTVRDCGFFGCGVLGISAEYTRDLRVSNTDLYECQSGGAEILNCRDVVLDGCRIYDCAEGQNIITVFESTVSFNGNKLDEGAHLFDEDEYLGPVSYGW